MPKTAYMKIAGLVESVEEDLRLLGLQLQLLRWVMDRKERRGSGGERDKRPGAERGRQPGRPPDG